MDWYKKNTRICYYSWEPMCNEILMPSLEITWKHLQNEPPVYRTSKTQKSSQNHTFNHLHFFKYDYRKKYYKTHKSVLFSTMEFVSSSKTTPPKKIILSLLSRKKSSYRSAYFEYNLSIKRYYF